MDTSKIKDLLKNPTFWKVLIPVVIIFVLIIVVIVFATRTKSLEEEVERNAGKDDKPAESFKGRCKRCKKD